jgi:hypothetical protein
MKLFKSALILGLFVFLCSVNLYADTCANGASGKIVSIGTVMCGASSCYTYKVTLDTGTCVVSIPIQTSIGLLTYAMDRGKVVTISTYAPSTWSTSCYGCTYGHISVAK